jgi:septal ring factor EnvC (AmiA/AmiB activator)
MPVGDATCPVTIRRVTMETQQRSNYKKNIEEFNRRIREIIKMNEEYLAQIEKLEAIYERNNIEEGNNGTATNVSNPA